MNKADKLAKSLVANPDSDPEKLLLAQQLLRRGEVIGRLEERLNELQDNTLDLINANRDTILRIYKDGLRRIAKVLKRYEALDHSGHVTVFNAIGAIDHELLYKILFAVNTFHLMHGESWCGWPEGS